MLDFSMSLSPEQERVKNAAHNLGREFRAHVADWDRSDSMPVEQVIKQARELELTGLTMPRRYGGQDFSVVEYVIGVEEITRACGFSTVSELLFLTSGPGASICMMSENGKVKEKYLSRIVSGDSLATVAITEPEHGSDMTNLETTAVEEGEFFRINGRKRFITGSVPGSVHSTFVRFGGIPGAKGIGAIMIEDGMPGVSIGRGPAWLGTRGIPHGELVLDDALVPKENLLFRDGEFSRIMTAFNMERMHNAALGLGLAEAAYDEAMEYVTNRKQFGTEVINFQAMQHAIAEMWVEIEALRFLTYRAAATAIDGKYPRGLETSIAKAYGNEVVPRLCQRALMMHGGDGYTTDYSVERILRDSLALPLGGGTVQMLKNMIAQWIIPGRKLQRARGGDG